MTATGWRLSTSSAVAAADSVPVQCPPERRDRSAKPSGRGVEGSLPASRLPMGLFRIHRKNSEGQMVVLLKGAFTPLSSAFADDNSAQDDTRSGGHLSRSCARIHAAGLEPAGELC